MYAVFLKYIFFRKLIHWQRKGNFKQNSKLCNYLDLIYDLTVCTLTFNGKT